MANQRFTEDTAKMLCHVTRPDSVVMEVEVDAKANGEDCLNKVRCVGIHIKFCCYGSFLKRIVAVTLGSSALVFLQNFVHFSALSIYLNLKRILAFLRFTYSGNYGWGNKASLYAARNKT